MISVFTAAIALQNHFSFLRHVMPIAINDNFCVHYRFTPRVMCPSILTFSAHHIVTTLLLIHQKANPMIKSLIIIATGIKTAVQVRYSHKVNEYRDCHYCVTNVLFLHSFRSHLILRLLFVPSNSLDSLDARNLT